MSFRIITVFIIIWVGIISVAFGQTEQPEPPEVISVSLIHNNDDTYDAEIRWNRSVTLGVTEYQISKSYKPPHDDWPEEFDAYVPGDTLRYVDLNVFNNGPIDTVAYQVKSKIDGSDPYSLVYYYPVYFHFDSDSYDVCGRSLDFHWNSFNKYDRLPKTGVYSLANRYEINVRLGGEIISTIPVQDTLSQVIFPSLGETYLVNVVAINDTTSARSESNWLEFYARDQIIPDTKKLVRLVNHGSSLSATGIVLPEETEIGEISLMEAGTNQSGVSITEIGSNGEVGLQSSGLPDKNKAYSMKIVMKCDTPVFFSNAIKPIVLSVSTKGENFVLNWNKAFQEEEIFTLHFTLDGSDGSFALSGTDTTVTVSMSQIGADDAISTYCFFIESHSVLDEEISSVSNTVCINKTLKVHVRNFIVPTGVSPQNRLRPEISNAGDIQEYRFIIYDAYGSKIIDRDRYDVWQWDGKRPGGGGPVESGAYIYYIFVRNQKEQLEKSGIINVIYPN